MLGKLLPLDCVYKLFDEQNNFLLMPQIREKEQRE